MSFPAPRPSVVERARSGHEETRRVAFQTIVDAFWKPVYKRLRLKWSLTPDEAAGLTEEFFKTTVQQDVVNEYDPRQASFLTHLRLCLDRFASHAAQTEHRWRSAGDIVTEPLDFASAESEITAQEQTVSCD